MLILLELFSIFWTHKVHYKLHQSTLQNFDDGGLLSGWHFVRVVFCPVVLCPVVFFPCTFVHIDWKSKWILPNFIQMWLEPMEPKVSSTRRLQSSDGHCSCQCGRGFRLHRFKSDLDELWQECDMRSVPHRIIISDKIDGMLVKCTNYNTWHSPTRWPFGHPLGG